MIYSLWAVMERDLCLQQYMVFQRIIVCLSHVWTPNYSLFELTYNF